MSSEPSPHITELLRAWSGGDESAVEQLMPFVYGELRRRAHACMAHESPGATLQPTALVNEAYLRLIDAGVTWHDRAHFFAIAARMMRRILIDAARARGAVRRGGPSPKVTLDEGLTPAVGAEPELEALDAALEELARKDKRKADVVEMRFFGGLSVREIAAVLRVSEDTVGRDWTFAKAWLANEMQ
jgi:RNA polymerase sigma factor (TIGR02999 family)